MKFALASENSGTVWEFEIDMSLDEFRAWYDTQEYLTPWGGRMLGANHYADFVSEMEDNGVLDCGGGTELELYHSYEIEEDMFPVILEKFREFFREKGLKVRDEMLIRSANDDF